MGETNMTTKNSTNKTIAEAIGWRKCEERSDGTLFGFCPDTKPWPNKGCFNCPREVPDYEAILMSENNEQPSGSPMHPASCAWWITCSPNEWKWTQEEQEAMARAVVDMAEHIAMLHREIRHAVDDFNNTKWGWDGDCGTADVISILESTLGSGNPPMHDTNQ